MSFGRAIMIFGSGEKIENVIDELSNLTDNGSESCISMKISLLLENHSFGPYEPERIESFLADGRISSDALAWRPGLPDWLPLKDVLGLPAESSGVSESEGSEEDISKITELIRKGEEELALDLATGLNCPKIHGELLAGCCFGADGSLHLSDLYQGFRGKLSLFFRLLASAPEKTPLCSTIETKNFHSLKIENDYGIQELSFLEGFPHLEELQFKDCSSLEDFSSLAKLPNLKSLSVYACGSLKDLSFLQGLGITSLTINDCRSLTDLSALSGLSELGNLDLKGCSSIRELDCVKKLDLWNLVLPSQFHPTLCYYERVPQLITKTFYVTDEFIESSPFESAEELQQAFDEGSDEWVEFSHEISGEYDEMDEDWQDTIYDEWEFNAPSA